jgi:hypothetical protein
MSKLYNADDPETLAGIQDYDGNVEAYKHDNVVQCMMCLVLFDISDDVTSDLLSDDIKRDTGDWVCLECEDEYNENADYDPVREHGTHFVRGGNL